LSADRPAWAAPVYGFELEVEGRERAAVRYAPLAMTPPVERDISLILPEGVIAQQVEAILSEQGTSLLERAEIFDEYRGKGMDGRSVAWRLVFRAPDRTLKDDEVDKVVAGIVTRLKERLGVVRREA
jgi:phenylalanyl-tRNA synthetase beta chain